MVRTLAYASGQCWRQNNAARLRVLEASKPRGLKPRNPATSLLAASATTAREYSRRRIASCRSGTQAWAKSPLPT